MHRIGGPLPATPIVRIQVTLGISAVGRLNRQRRIIAQVALIAARYFSCGSNLMRIRQRETSIRVIKRRIRPRNRVVALRTE